MSSAWSYSSLSTYIKCPRKYQAEKITREIPREDTEATIYGKAVHLAAEEYIRDGVPVPEQFAFIQPMLDKLSALHGDKYCELEMGIAVRDGKFEPCAFDAEDAWFRGIADLVIIDGEECRLVDYKTSKSPNYADTKQLALMAACIFLKFPQVNVVKGGLLFVVAKAFIKAEYKRERRFDIFSELDGPLRQLEVSRETNVWNTIPSGLCKKHCGVLSCPHNGRNA